MRFRVIFKSQRDHHFVIRFDNGQVARVNPNAVRHLKAGDTGRVLQGRKHPRFVLDAIDA